MKILRSKIGMAIFCLSMVVMFAFSFHYAFAVDSATSTLDTIMGSIITTTVALATTLFTTYWPYVLVFAIISGLVGVFARFLHIGGKK